MVNDYDKELQNKRYFEQLEESLDYLMVNDPTTMLILLQNRIGELSKENELSNSTSNNEEKQVTKDIKKLQELINKIGKEDSVFLTEFLSTKIKNILVQRRIKPDRYYGNISTTKFLTLCKILIKNTLELVKIHNSKYKEFDKAFEKLEEAELWIKSLDSYYEDDIDDVEIDGTQLKVKV